jgi:hypothetical protein
MAKKGKDKNYVSFWFWFFALFIVAIPCVGVIMVIIWALVGENESRKNYYRACIAWFLILIAIWCSIIGFGFLPAILHQVQIWIQQYQHTHK